MSVVAAKLKDNNDLVGMDATGEYSLSATNQFSVTKPTGDDFQLDGSASEIRAAGLSGKSGEPAPQHQYRELGIEISDAGTSHTESIGVMVRNVSDDTVGAHAGLQENDIITHFNDQPTPTVHDFCEKYHEALETGHIQFRLHRNGQVTEIQIEVEDGPDGEGEVEM